MIYGCVFRILQKKIVEMHAKNNILSVAEICSLSQFDNR